MRLAIISTPRSGNTWVRTVLADVYGLSQIAVHNPAELPAKPPERVVVQLHWYREPSLQAWLHRHEFQVLVLARHPLDVLISILHFVRREPETARWLEGNAELPTGLGSACPTDPVFESYALSWGAENLLGVSYAWWHEPHAIKLHYEDLVRDPLIAFGQMIAVLAPGHQPLEDALQRSRLAVWQATWNHHGWQGKPGLWKSLVTPRTATRIYLRHLRLFRTLNYSLEPYVLTRAEARRQWAKLAKP